jgi:hypothetical protein
MKLRVPDSRDFGVQFWIMAAIDFINFPPSLYMARVPTKQSAFRSSGLNQALTSRSRSQRRDFQIVRHSGYRVVSICPQVKPQAGTIAAFARRNFPRD